MSEPKKPALVAVDENYVLPTDVAKLEPAARVEAKQRAQAANHIKEGRRRERADIFQAAGAQSIEELSMLAKTVDALKAERIQWVREAKAHGRYQGITFSAIILVPLAVFGMWGVMTLTRMDVIAAQRVQQTPAWQPPAQTERQGFQ